VTGASRGSGNTYDYATIKYSSAGVPLWTNRYDGPGNDNDWAYAVAVDSNNDVIVTGDSRASGNTYDYATIKYSSAGVPLWTNGYNGSGNGIDMATAVAVDGDNNVIVTGMSANVGGSFDYATIKYASGGWPLWVSRYNGPGNGDDDANAVAVDGNNNVIVTGSSSGGYATIKYYGNGYPLWTNRYDGPGNGGNSAFAVAVDGSDNVIVTGSSASTNGYPDYATIKYSNAGTPLWTNRYDGPLNISDEAVAMAVDGNDNVVVTGYSTSQNYPVPYNKDYVTIKYASAGAPLWTNRYNGSGDSEDTVAAVVVDQSGYVIVTGGSVGSEGYYDIATIKYAYSPMFSDFKLTDGTFQIWLENLTSPGTVMLEASTNLVGWSPLITNTAPTNVLFYTDQETSNHLWRFYRARKL